MHCYCYEKKLHKILSEWINAMVFGVKAAAGTDQKPGPPSVDQILEDLQVGLFTYFFLGLPSIATSSLPDLWTRERLLIVTSLIRLTCE